MASRRPHHPEARIQRQKIEATKMRLYVLDKIMLQDTFEHNRRTQSVAKDALTATPDELRYLERTIRLGALIENISETIENVTGNANDPRFAKHLEAFAKADAMEINRDEDIEKYRENILARNTAIKDALRDFARTLWRIRPEITKIIGAGAAPPPVPKP